MKKTNWNVLCAASVLTCGLMFGCEDNSASPQENASQPSSSAADVSGANDGGLLSSSEGSSATGSSAVVESSSSVAAPKTLCHIDLKTMKGYLLSDGLQYSDGVGLLAYG